MLSNWAAGVILVGLGMVLLFIFFAARVPTSSGVSSISLFWDFGVTTLTVVVFLGAMGGLVSVQQRLQNASDAGDQLYNVAELMHAKGVLVSAVSGATFAAVLYLLITAGLLEGGLFPELRTPLHDGRTSPAASPTAGDAPAVSSPAGTSQGQTQQTGISFVQFLLQTSPQSASDYAKLMIWSCLAGFAERLVPDPLSRVVARKETEPKATT
jgi:hypothetical protein